MRNGRMLVTFMFPSPFLDAFPGSGARRRLAAAFESDALQEAAPHRTGIDRRRIAPPFGIGAGDLADQPAEGDEGPGDGARDAARGLLRSEEHTSELQSLMRISYAVFCLKKKQ